MPKPHPIQINIVDPCHQSWDDMTAAGQGRFCNACQKTVVDFTTYSDAALYRFFATNPQNVCGRFLNTQLGIPINIPHQPHSHLYRMTIALGLTLLFTQTPALLAQTRPPVAAQSATAKPADSTGKVDCRISGRVYDDKKEPMIAATVQVHQGGILKGGGSTDYDGRYSIAPLAAGYYDVLVTYTGYDSVRLNGVAVSSVSDSIQDVIMKPRITLTDMQIVTMGGPMTRPVAPSLEIFAQSQLYGRVKDKHGKALKDVIVRVYQHGNIIGERKTDNSGVYSAIWLNYGTYELHILYLDHNDIIIKNVKVNGDSTLRNITIPDNSKPNFTGGKTF